MGKKELSKRDNWQEDSGGKATVAEQNVLTVFQKEFSKQTDFEIINKPKELNNLYSNVRLEKKVLDSIYTPPEGIANAKWGISPDFAIKNKKTEKILFGEIKRQDGWVEGKPPSAGRGNAHERLCKLFTPGLLNTYRKHSGITNQEILPFWVIFQGDITRDPKRVREITFWFDKYKHNFFLWQPAHTELQLIQHFNKFLKSYLE